MVRALRAAIRDLRRAPAHAALVVLTLGLGIGATTAMFSVVDAVLLRPLPYPNIERFAEIWIQPASGSRTPGLPETATGRLREALADAAEVEGYQMGSATITGGREPDIVGAPSISPRLLELVGAAPYRGRLFSDDDLSAQARPIIVSYRYWATQFGSDPAIVGRTVEIDDVPHTVIGVMSPRVRYPEANAAIWRPLNLNPAQPSRRRVQAVTVRRAGVSVDQFQARLSAASVTLVDARLIPDRSRLQPDVLLQERFGRSDHRAFWLMFGAVLLVLLVACVNAGNLLLARASARHGEFALRGALGASRSRIMLATFSECVLLATGAALVGVAMARMLLTILLEILPPQLTFLSANASEIDLRVLAFTALISLGACLLSGIVPSWRASRIAPIDALKQHAVTLAGRDDAWHGLLTAAQLSLVLVLLTGAGLLMRSFVRLTGVETGFKPDGLILVDVEMPSRRYRQPGSALHLLEEVQRRLEADGITQVTIAGGAPLTSPAISFNIAPEAESGLDVDFTGREMPFTHVAGDYFQTIGVPILAGRSFADDDPEDTIIINDRLARGFWGDVSPLGKRLRFGAKDSWKTVVGIVGDVKQLGLDDPTGHGMEYYVPHSRGGAGGWYSLLVRTPRDPEEAIAFVKETVWALDPRLPFSEATTMHARIGESLYRQRFFLRLSSAFTVIASLLALVGVYGAFTYWVTQRRRELAIRIAVGATPRGIVAIVLQRALRIAGVGAAMGLLMAIAGAGVIEAMLFEIDPRDPVTLISVTVILALAALSACAFPAIRASRVDPMATLRAE